MPEAGSPAAYGPATNHSLIVKYSRGRLPGPGSPDGLSAWYLMSVVLPSILRLHRTGGLAPGKRPVQSPRQPTGRVGEGRKSGEPSGAAAVDAGPAARVEAMRQAMIMGNSLLPLGYFFSSSPSSAVRHSRSARPLWYAAFQGPALAPRGPPSGEISSCQSPFFQSTWPFSIQSRVRAKTS